MNYPDITIGGLLDRIKDFYALTWEALTGLLRRTPGWLAGDNPHYDHTLLRLAIVLFPRARSRSIHEHLLASVIAFERAGAIMAQAMTPAVRQASEAMRAFARAFEDVRLPGGP